MYFQKMAFGPQATYEWHYNDGRFTQYVIILDGVGLLLKKVIHHCEHNKILIHYNVPKLCLQTFQLVL